mmetsp:Transcript_8974/g.24452  ORF Transcript_8974/g.24452 Transcript_8974/m.24452 type:complete len:83 (+) Transcript_8974:200-448(+)
MFLCSTSHVSRSPPTLSCFSPFRTLYSSLPASGFECMRRESGSQGLPDNGYFFSRLHHIKDVQVVEMVTNKKKPLFFLRRLT